MMFLKSRCRFCGRAFLKGQADCCEKCLSGTPPRKKVKPLRCYCGKTAVEVMLGDVLNPDGEVIFVEVALCRDCYNLELEMEAEMKGRKTAIDENQIQIMVVKSLPRSRSILRGKKI